MDRTHAPVHGRGRHVHRPLELVPRDSTSRSSSDAEGRDGLLGLGERALRAGVAQHRARLSRAMTGRGMARQGDTQLAPRLLCLAALTHHAHPTHSITHTSCALITPSPLVSYESKRRRSSCSSRYLRPSGAKATGSDGTDVVSSSTERPLDPATCRTHGSRASL